MSENNNQTPAYRDGFEISGNYWGEDASKTGPADIEEVPVPAKAAENSATETKEQKEIKQDIQAIDYDTWAALRATL
jgi:hypothetical protein